MPALASQLLYDGAWPSSREIWSKPGKRQLVVSFGEHFPRL